MIKILIAALLTVSLMTVTGCKKASEKLTEKIVEKAIEREGGGKAAVDIQEGKVTIKTKDGTMEAATGSSAKIPDGFPKDVHVIKNATITMSLKTPDAFQLMIETKDSVENAASQYSAEMKASGWNEETNMNMGESVMHAYKKGNRQASIIITKGQQGAQIQIVASPE
ncbi:MAG: hypothetical protein FJ395_05030 [Verrucomicrobia bacterium]|nr:hypothetical protein [Verrucomicrobiota bacterium]